MGQQQLLLVILVTIIVGIATVVAINIFGTAAQNANRDAIRQDLLTGATQAQALWTRPVMMGGGGNDFATNLSVAQIADRIGIPGTTVGAVITNENAVYTIGNPTEFSLTIDAVPTGSEGNWSITVLRQGNGTWLTTINDYEGQLQIMGNEQL